METVTWKPDTPWDEVLKSGEREELLLVCDGHAVALIGPFDDEDLSWCASERDPAFLASIEEARRQIERGETIGHDDLRRELGIDVEDDEPGAGPSRT